MSLVVAVVVLVGFLCYREWYHSRQMEKLEDRYFVERQQLLDRLMSQDFMKYKQAEALSKVPIEIPQTEEDYDYSVLGN